MAYDQQTVQLLQGFSSAPWKGVVFRHMFANFPPDRENIRGARWNPPDAPAIYTSLARETCIAEAEYYIDLQSVRPSARRVVYRIEVSLERVLDLSAPADLVRIGLTRQNLVSTDHSDCQRIGGVVEWLQNDGLLVPSVRAEGFNLVIFPNRRKEGYRFRAIDSEEIN